MVNVAVSPALTILEDGEAATEKSMPIPVSPAEWGLPGPSSVMVSVALRAPAAVGLKVTLKVQLAPAASVAGNAPQVFVWAKSPLVAMALIVSGALPLLVSVTVCAALVVPTFWLPKLRLAGDSVTAGAVGAAGEILVTKASLPPPDVVWKAPRVVGKLVEPVCPVT